MAAVDAANFVLERGQPNVVTMAGLLAPGGFVDSSGVPDVDALRETLAPRLERLDALHRVAVAAEGDWMWQTTTLDLSHHIRVIRPEPGGQPGTSAVFERTCARVLMERLEPGLPPWEILLAPRVEEDRCGILFRLHHGIADGLGAEALIAAMADPRPVGTAAAQPPQRTEPAPLPRRPFYRRFGDLTAQTFAVFRRSVHSEILLGPLGPTRDVGFLDVDLARLHDSARRNGGTINDVYLAAFGQGMKALLLAAGEAPPASVPISIPVQLPRLRGEGNATGVMLIDVPLADADLGYGLGGAVGRIAAMTTSEKARARAVGTFQLMSNPRGARLLMHFAQRQRAVAAIASELIGPTQIIRLGGADLVAAWPLALLSGNVRVGTLAVSYADRFRISVQTDGTHLPPARVLADGMAAAFDRIDGRGP